MSPTFNLVAERSIYMRPLEEGIFVFSFRLLFDSNERTCSGFLFLHWPLDSYDQWQKLLWDNFQFLQPNFRPWIWRDFTKTILKRKLTLLTGQNRLDSVQWATSVSVWQFCSVECGNINSSRASLFQKSFQCKFYRGQSPNLHGATWLICIFQPYSTSLRTKKS